MTAPKYAEGCLERCFRHRTREAHEREHYTIEGLERTFGGKVERLEELIIGFQDLKAESGRVSDELPTITKMTKAAPNKHRKVATKWSGSQSVTSREKGLREHAIDVLNPLELPASALLKWIPTFRKWSKKIAIKAQTLPQSLAELWEPRYQDAFSGNQAHTGVCIWECHCRA